MSQYAYFVVRSLTVPAAKVAAHLGLEPDQLPIRREGRVEPTALPEEHSWAIYCAERGLRLDEQIGRLIERLAPVKDALVTLVREHDARSVLVVVRIFNDREGEGDLFDPIRADDGDVLSWLSRDHHLLGWRLSAEHLGFLASIDADMVAEEHS